MAIPLLPILAVLAAAELVEKGWNVYSTEQTTKANDIQNRYIQQFYGAYGAESDDYMRRYIRAHHLEGRNIRYPIRSGLSPNLSALYGAGSKLTSNQYARYGSYVHAGTGTVKTVGYGRAFAGSRYVPKKNYTDIMYG